MVRTIRMPRKARVRSVVKRTPEEHKLIKFYCRALEISDAEFQRRAEANYIRYLWQKCVANELDKLHFDEREMEAILKPVIGPTMDYANKLIQEIERRGMDKTLQQHLLREYVANHVEKHISRLLEEKITPRMTNTVEKSIKALNEATERQIVCLIEERKPGPVKTRRERGHPDYKEGTDVPNRILPN